MPQIKDVTRWRIRKKSPCSIMPKGNDDKRRRTESAMCDHTSCDEVVLPRALSQEVQVGDPELGDSETTPLANVLEATQARNASLLRDLQAEQWSADQVRAHFADETVYMNMQMILKNAPRPVWDWLQRGLSPGERPTEGGVPEVS